MAFWNRFPPRTRIELEGRVERRGWASNRDSGPFAISEAAVSSGRKATICICGVELAVSNPSRHLVQRNPIHMAIRPQRN